MKSLTADLLKLRSLLEQERETLMRANMEGVERLAERKTALLDRLEACEVLPANDREKRLAADVARDARRNQALIQAALEGVRDAQDLLARVRQPKKLETYGRDGARETMVESRGQLERRA